jgi:hypothetical protein
MPDPGAMAFSDMGEPRGYAKAKIQLEDFPGLMNNVDPFDTPPGAALIQVNCCSILLGELRVRSGYREVRFEAGG